jgi:hypothetical protein
LNQQPHSHKPHGFAATLIASLLVAAAAFVGPFFFGTSSGLKFLFCLIVLPILWATLLVAAYFRYRSRRWFWFLLGSPLALWWLYFIAITSVTNTYP